MGKLRWSLEGEPGDWGAFAAIERREKKSQRSVIFHSWGQVVCVEWWSVEEGKLVTRRGEGRGSKGSGTGSRGWWR